MLSRSLRMLASLCPTECSSPWLMSSSPMLLSLIKLGKLSMNFTFSEFGANMIAIVLSALTQGFSSSRVAVS